MKNSSSCVPFYMTITDDLWPYSKTQVTHCFFFVGFIQVCDSDTMLDPASSVEMVKVLEEDPMVGGVGGDVQVRYKTKNTVFFLESDKF